MYEEGDTTFSFNVKAGDISYSVFMSGYDSEEVSEILDEILPAIIE